ncbi:MAG: carbohydrate kinase family protein [Spirochaetia bacterium]|nr:carbohydrate kinase family protein [Spirochaetia bacterium]
MLDIVGFGVNAIDQVIQLYRIPTADAKVVCPPEKYELYPGGVMGNTLTGLARLGLKTGFIGKIGDDNFGSLLQQYSREDGIDMSACTVEAGTHSPWTWIVVDKEGERTITFFQMCSIRLPSNIYAAVRITYPLRVYCIWKAQR